MMECLFVILRIGDMCNPIPCSSPLSIRGMLPVMLIVIIIYFQKMICSSNIYELVEQQIRSEEAKAVKQSEPNYLSRLKWNIQIVREVDMKDLIQSSD